MRRERGRRKLERKIAMMKFSALTKSKMREWSLGLKM